MKDLLVLHTHLLTTFAKLIGRGTIRRKILEHTLFRNAQNPAVNAWTSGKTTIGIGFINRQVEIRRQSLAANLNLYAQNSVTIRGYRIVTDFFRSRLPCDAGIRHPQGAGNGITVDTTRARRRKLRIQTRVRLVGYRASPRPCTKYSTPGQS